MTNLPVDSLFLSFQEAVAGRYSLERELGRGGMGVVYLARDVRLDRAVAIKLLPPELAAQATLRERFLREARMAARLSHPYIVPIHAVDEAGDFVFYVMAYVNGETLSDRVRSRGPLPAADVSRILREVAWALAYAHAQGVVHRDIKPANILLEAGTNRALVTDFGIARQTNVPGETGAGELLGTPEYMSPEQACGEQIDGRSDLYSLGVVGYFATTGTLPFTGGAREVLAQQITKAPAALASVAPAAPRSLTSAIDRCLLKEPAQRFASGEELADALALELERRSEIPVPLRVFLERRNLAPLVILPVMGSGFALLVVSLFPNNAGPQAMVLLGGLAVFWGGPLLILRESLRKMMRAGFGVNDIAQALRTMTDRKREEFLYEFGPKQSWREKLVLGFGAVSVGIFVPAFIAGTLAPVFPNELEALSMLSLYGSLIGLGIGMRWARLRKGAEPLVAKFWRGPVGKLFERFAGYKLGQRAIPADRPTELGIAMSAEALYADLDKATRKAVGNVPAVLKSLEAQAREMRARVTALDDSLAEAQRSVTARASSMPSAAKEIQAKLVDDLKSTRTAAEARHADIVTAMETLRLNLLRLRAGAAKAESVTQDLAAAQALSEDVDRLLEGASEVELALRPPTTPLPR